MAIVAFARRAPDLVAGPEANPAPEKLCSAELRLRSYGRAMRILFICALTLWVILQVGCLLSLYLHFRSGIVAGTIDGTLAFRYWPRINDFAHEPASSSVFVPQIFSLGTAIGYTIVLIIASVPFCGSLLYLARLFELYSRLQVFTRQNSTIMRRLGHLIMATGWSPLLLGPIAHAIGVLKPVTGLTEDMIACMLAGMILLAISYVMEIGQRMRQEQEEIL